jgi:hypothetical protein
MNVRRLVLNVGKLIVDVDKAATIVGIASAVETVPGVEGTNITVRGIRAETMDLNGAIEGNDLSYDEIVKAIKSTGAVIDSIEQLISGRPVVEGLSRSR